MIVSARVLVPEVHLARRQMEFHGAEKSMGLLVLCDTRGCSQVDLLVIKTSLLLLHLVDAAEALSEHEYGKRGPSTGAKTA